MKKLYLLLTIFALVYGLVLPNTSFVGGGSNCVILYSKPNFKGEHKRVCGDKKDLSKIGWDNKTRSMIVEDIIVYLYFDKNYKKYYGQGRPHTGYLNVHLRFNTIEA